LLFIYWSYGITTAGLGTGTGFIGETGAGAGSTGFIGETGVFELGDLQTYF